jgi:DNA-binding HxlR family transcriptional regulator
MLVSGLYEDRTMSEAIRHLKVPVEREERDICLGPDGSVAHVTRVLRMISGRWKLPILFRLFAEPSMRSSQLLRDIPDISQKMLTQHLRELENDGLIARRDFGEQPPRVEYGLTNSGRGLMPVLMSVREFSRLHLVH